MLNRPRSSLPTTRRIRASRLSARSSGGMSRVPIAAWKVRLSRLRTRTVLRIELIRFVGSAVGGSGRGILPRGPRTTPSRFPIGHQRRLGDEEIVRGRKGPRLPLVARVFLDLLRLDDEVRDGPRLQREFPGGEHANANRFAAPLRKDDFLVHAILRHGKVDVPQVHRYLDGLLELPGLRGLQELLDRLNRMLVRQGKSPPAVRAANGASCTGEAAKECGPNKALRVSSPLTNRGGGRRRMSAFGITSFA